MARTDRHKSQTLGSSHKPLADSVTYSDIKLTALAMLESQFPPTSKQQNNICDN